MRYPDETKSDLYEFHIIAPGVGKSMRTGRIRLSYERTNVTTGIATQATQDFGTAEEALAEFGRWQRQQPDRWRYVILAR